MSNSPDWNAGYEACLRDHNIDHPQPPSATIADVLEAVKAELIHNPRAYKNTDEVMDEVFTSVRQRLSQPQGEADDETKTKIRKSMQEFRAGNVKSWSEVTKMFGWDDLVAVKVEDLKAIEWCSTHTDSESYYKYFCPVCDGSKPNGGYGSNHKDDCWLGNALKSGGAA